MNLIVLIEAIADRIAENMGTLRGRVTVWLIANFVVMAVAVIAFTIGGMYKMSVIIYCLLSIVMMIDGIAAGLWIGIINPAIDILERWI